MDGDHFLTSKFRVVSIPKGSPIEEVKELRDFVTYGPYTPPNLEKNIVTLSGVHEFAYSMVGSHSKVVWDPSTCVQKLVAFNPIW